MINVLYSSLVVCFCLMFPQTKYEYDLLLLWQNDSLFYLHMFITLLSYVFYTISMYTVSLIYLERGLYLENKLLSLSLPCERKQNLCIVHVVMWRGMSMWCVAAICIYVFKELLK